MKNLTDGELLDRLALVAEWLEQHAQVEHSTPWLVHRDLVRLAMTKYRALLAQIEQLQDALSVTHHQQIAADAKVAQVQQERDDDARIRELMTEFDCREPDELKHRLEDWERWRRDVVQMDVELAQLRAERAKGEEALKTRREHQQRIIEVAHRLYRRFGKGDADVMDIWSLAVIDPEPLTEAEIAYGQKVIAMLAKDRPSAPVAPADPTQTDAPDK